MFREYFDSIDLEQIKCEISAKNSSDVEIALTKSTLTIEDFAALLSPAAIPFLEKIAQRAQHITHANFGKIIQLYSPLYISSYCSNTCTYCGFSSENKMERKKLTFEEIEKEAALISATGIKHILFLTGEAPQKTDMEYLVKCISILKKYFASISMEIFPLATNEYATLCECGVEGVTIYQETYNKEIYSNLHLQGKKRDFYYRLDTPDRCGQAGVRNINIGALFGLADPAIDGYLAGIHAHYLINTYPEAEISISLPRINPIDTDFVPTYKICDMTFVQTMLAYRLFLPKAGITISTREKADFRNNLVGLGPTRFSAGSKTNVGGYSSNDGLSQFDISDTRSVAELSSFIKNKGYDPVYKDWENIK